MSLPASALVTYFIVSLGLSTASFNPDAGFVAVSTALAASAGMIYLSGILIGMAVVVGIPRLLNIFVVPEVAHPLYGFQYELARTIQRLSNNRALNTLFGDSSMIVYWLSLVGYDLRRNTQTGSNFGVDQRHHSPFLCVFNRNTLVSDGLLMMNMETSASSFILRKIEMPPDTYVGNVVHYPADAKLGPNCLIATKAAIPLDGAVRSDVGILGSPPFEIPRSVARDLKFEYFKQPGIFEQRLAMKLRSNLTTLGLFLLRSWAVTLIGLILTIGTFYAIEGDEHGSNVLTTTTALTLSALAFLTVSALFSIACERVVCQFRRLEPRYCSLYDPLFWAHERFWKLNYNGFLAVFNGTPMKPFFLRLQGAKVGRRLFDDGAGFTEPSMVDVGDDCMLNYRSVVQCHSLEDGTFKSDRISIGSRCTIGIGGFIHYGSTMQDDSALGADTFLMKGSVVEAGTRWLGNPARDADSAKDAKLTVAKGAMKW